MPRRATLATAIFWRAAPRGVAARRPIHAVFPFLCLGRSTPAAPPRRVFRTIHPRGAAATTRLSDDPRRGVAAFGRSTRHPTDSPRRPIYCATAWTTSDESDDDRRIGPEDTKGVLMTAARRRRNRIKSAWNRGYQQCRNRRWSERVHGTPESNVSPSGPMTVASHASKKPWSKKP